MQKPTTPTYKILEKANLHFRSKNYADAIDLYRELLLDHQRGNLSKNILLSIRKWKIEKPTTDIEWKKSVLFVTAGLKGPTPGGGIATCFYNMITEFSASTDNRVTVLYAANPYYATGDVSYWTQYFMEKYGVKFIGLHTNPKDYGSTEMKRSFAISRFLEEHDGAFDKIIFHDFSGLAFYPALGKKHRTFLEHTSITISAHGNHELSFYFGSKKVKSWADSAVMYMERLSLSMADEIFVPSRYYANWLAEKFCVKNAKVQPNIIKKNADFACDSKIDLPLQKDMPTLFFYGRLERLKGIDLFILAINRLNEQGEIFNLVFAGNKTRIDETDAEEYIRSNIDTTKNRIFFVFNTKPTPFFDLVRRSNGCCIYPTLGETSSCVVVESILEQVSFIASNIEGIKELIDPNDHNRVLFEAGNHEDLSKKISTFINSNSSHLQAKLNFDMEKNIGEWVQAIETISKPHTLAFTPTPTNKLISVIVPTCDRPELLNKSLLSLSSQTYKNFEIIVVDDCSIETANNRLICERYGAKYIFLEEKSYKGKACNIAAKEASGEYLCFFDDDDIATSKMLSNYIKAFSTAPSLDIISCFAGVFEHSPGDKEATPAAAYTSLAIGGNSETNFSCNFFGKGTFIVRTERFFSIGGYEEDAAPIPMVDYRFYIKASLKGAVISIIPKALYLYRKNSPNSLYYTNTDNKRMLYLAKHGIQKIFIEHFGDELGRAFIPHIWNVGQPTYK